MATGLHGGLLLAFADQIGATSVTKTQTEISILDLPSVSGTTKLDAKSVDRIQPKSESRLKPAEKAEENRLKNSSERKTAKTADNNAKLIEKVEEKSLAETIKDASSVLPVSSSKLANTVAKENTEITGPIENLHEISETIPRDRISETNSPITIAKTPQPTKTDPQPVSAKVLSRQKSKANNLKSTHIAQPTKKTKDIKTAKLTSFDKIKLAQPSAAGTKIISSRTTPKIASQQTNNSSKIATFTPAAKPVKSNSQATKLVSTRKTKRAKKATSKLRVNSSIAPAIQTRKTTRVSTSYLKKPNSITTVARVKTSRSQHTISSSQSMKAAKPKPSNPVAISTKTAKQITPKSSSTKLVSHLRIGRIKTAKANTNNSQAVKNNTSIKVARLARPIQIAPKTLSEPTNRQVDGFAKIVNFVKFYNSENPCFLALPVISNADKMVLTGFSNEKSSWPRFQKALAQNTKFGTTGRLASISDAQCQVIKFARQSNSYPSYSVSLQLDFPSIKNGEFIAGKIYINDGQHLDLLLVDDEGTAININRFVKIDKDYSTFQLQVNLTGGEVSTSQLLLAIVTDRLLDSTQSHAPIRVTNLLQNIQLEISAKNINMNLALSGFVVE